MTGSDRTGMGSSESRIGRIASDVLRYRRDGAQCTADTQQWDIGTLDEANAIQDRVAESMGETVVGWKAGATDAAVRLRRGLSEPFIGRVFRSRCLSSPATLPAQMASPCMVECELTCQLGELPAQDTPWSLAQIDQSILAWHPSYEIVDFAWRNWRSLGIRDYIADNGGTGALVVGAGIVGWREIELSDHAVELQVNRKHVLTQPIARTWDELISIVAWLANHVRTRGIGSAAGAMVATGTLTGMTELASGETAEARFGTLGTVTATLPAAKHHSAERVRAEPAK